MPHVMRGNLPFFCKTSHPKLFHEFIVGSHSVLIEQNLRKNSREFKVDNFPMFFIYSCCEIQPNQVNRSN